ncbi:MAG TPA: agmatinase [Phycisphaerales bacterium]|nr:agmatinase [Phycisphaerales bacterium]HRQ74397.1 agmatinase [Phycisphaerales bacterium]
MTTPSRTALPNAREYPRFAGVPTFCRFPLIDNVPKDQQPVDWVLYGVPFDGGVTYRPGARFGPRAIRQTSAYIKPYHIEHEVNIAQVFSLADAGDAPVRPYSCKETLDAACSFAERLGDPRHTKLLAIGGDHSVAYANMRATWLRRGKPKPGFAVIHFDAHLDTAGPIWGEAWTHASPFRHAIEEGLIDPSMMLSMGIRGPLNTADDLDYAEQHGIEIITLAEAATDDGLDRLEAFIERLGDRETYLTFDIDCVDPAYAPGTGTPCCGGFTSGEAFDLLRAFAGVNLVGADVVEVLPDRDHADITALLASHVIFEILALAAVRGG